MATKQTALHQGVEDEECYDSSSSTNDADSESADDLSGQIKKDLVGASALRPMPKAWNGAGQRLAVGCDASKKNEAGQSGHLKLTTKWSRFRERVKQELAIEDVQEELTEQNYREKFHKLLCWEEKERPVFLKHRCDDVYKLVLYKDGSIPDQLLHRGIRDYRTHFGFLDHLPGDVISNVALISERASITVRGKCSVTASILPMNRTHTHNRLYLAFDAKGSLQLKKAMGNSDSIEICAEFEPTHRYFDSLHEAIDALPESAVRRLMPLQGDFSDPSRRLNKLPTEYDELRMDKGESGEQSQALKTALIYPAADPPVLILGPCGSGKTRVLAAAAYHILRDASSSGLPTRVLLCSHQASADLFIEQFFGIIKNNPSRPWQETVIRVVPPFLRNTGPYPLLYKTVSEFSKLLQDECSNHIIVVTTYNTSFDLWREVPDGYFTHILLDEAAQMTEPEVLSPLAMATSNTRIILAGDTCQTRPVVLGEEAWTNGLGTSLFKRLYEQYKEIGPQATSHLSVLTTSYRCHKDILNLSLRLFNHSGLQPGVPQPPTHPLAPYPLVFVCSSLDPTPHNMGEDTNEREASTLMHQVARFVDPWPEDWGERNMATICIAVSSKRQISVIRRLAAQYKRLGLNKVTVKTSYSILGWEFRAIFIAPSEPTWEDGECRNPTRSTCDPYLFNTVLTRAQSLVVVIGNPLVLLRMELLYSLYKEKCWTEYLTQCLHHNTVLATPSLEEEWHRSGEHLLRQKLCMSS